MRSLLLMMLLFSSACRHAPRGSGYPGVPQQPRQTTYSSLGGENESVPYGVPNDAVLDEATLYVQPDRVCANVVLRQPMGFDEPLSQLNMRCSADSRVKERTGPSLEQQPTERDYPFQGPPPMLRIRSAYGWANIPLGAASTNVFRVVERSFQVCCPFTASRVFRLTIDGTARYDDYVRTDFAWRLNDVGAQQ